MELKATNSSIFLVPLLKIEKDSLRNNGFLNAYVKDIGQDTPYEDCLYLLFKPRDLAVFKQFVDWEYIRTKDLIDDYDYEEFVVLVYKLDNKLKPDIDLIKQGKYSKTSSKYQNMIPKEVDVIKDRKVIKEVSLQYRIFNKAESLKTYWEERAGIDFKEDMEVWGTWEEANEILDIEKIKELCK